MGKASPNHREAPLHAGGGVQLAADDLLELFSHVSLPLLIEDFLSPQRACKEEK